jgi:hypothetical protein
MLNMLFAFEPEVMLRIERRSDGTSTNLKLSGRMQADALSELRAEIERCNPAPSLDLEEVTLLDRDTVRFLIRCQSEGIQLVNCPLYVQEWITREKRQMNSAPGVRSQF